MNTLDDMFRLLLLREQQYQANTLEIWSHIKFVTDGICMYLQAPGNTLHWHSVDVIGQEMALMVSTLNPDRFNYVVPGTVGSRILTIILPISVVETGDSQLIADYLNDTEDVRKNDNPPEKERGGVVAFSNSARRMIH